VIFAATFGMGALRSLLGAGLQLPWRRPCRNGLRLQAWGTSADVIPGVRHRTVIAFLWSLGSARSDDRRWRVLSINFHWSTGCANAPRSVLVISTMPNIYPTSSESTMIVNAAAAAHAPGRARWIVAPRCSTLWREAAKLVRGALRTPGQASELTRVATGGRGLHRLWAAPKRLADRTRGDPGRHRSVQNCPGVPFIRRQKNEAIIAPGRSATATTRTACCRRCQDSSTWLRATKKRRNQRREGWRVEDGEKHRGKVK